MGKLCPEGEGFQSALQGAAVHPILNPRRSFFQDSFECMLMIDLSILIDLILEGGGGKGNLRNHAYWQCQVGDAFFHFFSNAFLRRNWGEATSLGTGDHWRGMDFSGPVMIG